MAATSAAGGVRPAGTGPVTITVPGDAPTISAAVAVAHRGDLVLVSPGVYNESVKISTAGITLRGTDRASVVVDGGVLRANGITVTAPGVTIANLTVRNATLNGLLITGMSDSDGDGVAQHSDGYSTLDAAKFPPLQGFHVDHVTSYNNGLYGIYAFDAQYGLVENSFASGGADSGIYIGQCKPCHTVVRANVAERNAVGYEGANAGPDLYIVGNRFVGNRVGATIDSDYQEAFIPQTGTTLTGNVIADNKQPDTPEQADGGFGIGVGISGGTQNVVSKNLVTANPLAGLIITSSEDLSPKDNQIVGNTFTANKLDVAYSPTARGPGSGNCLTGNKLTTTSPAGLAKSLACPASGKVVAGADAPSGTAPAGIAFTEVKAPPKLPNLADVTTIGKVWAISDVPKIDAVAVTVPPATLLADQSAITW